MIFDLIAELFLGIVSAFVELVIRLMALIMQSGFMAHRTQGIIRYAYGLIAVLGVYLLFGIARATLYGWETPSLQPFYSWPLVIGAIALLLVAVAVPEAAREIANPDRKTARQEEPEMLWPLAILLSAVVVLGAIGLWQGEAHRRTLAERACDAANARISPDLREKAEKGLALADRVLRRESQTRLPCAE